MPVKHPRRVALAQLPTPLVSLPRLGRSLNNAKIWFKRDDLTGLELSGNKVRKLEYVLADAIARGCDTIITEGTPQSNHCRATAAACAKLGLGCHLLFRPDAPDGPAVGNHLLDTLFGARVSSFHREEFSAKRERIIADLIAEYEQDGQKARYTPMGASEPLGCWGYIRAAAELAEQIAGVGIGRCDIVVAISSGATYAGLLLGKAIHRLDDWRVWAVPVSDDREHHEGMLRTLCEQAIGEYGLPIEIDEIEPRFIEGYVGAGYAIPYEAAVDALRELAREEGLLLDPVYTAKAFCAVRDCCSDGRLGHDRPVVFVHTGGLFSDFAWPKLLIGEDHDRTDDD